MQQILEGERRSGKTTRLVQWAADNDAVIVTAYSATGRYVEQLAKGMGLSIRKPIVARMATREVLAGSKVGYDEGSLVILDVDTTNLGTHIIEAATRLDPSLSQPIKLSWWQEFWRVLFGREVKRG